MGISRPINLRITILSWLTSLLGVLALNNALTSEAMAQAVQRWSDPMSWNGAVPSKGDSVTIPAGKTFLLDVSPPELDGLTIKGALVFDPAQDISLTSRWIIVEGTPSRLEIGDEAVPYSKRATITLTGTDETRDVRGFGLGTKAIIVRAGGALEIHGASKSKLSWTQLNAHAPAGSTSLTLAKAPLWQVGDYIAIAPSGFDPIQAEKVQIAGINGASVSFTPALKHPHWGELQTIEGTLVDERAEVALLSRNVLIRGAVDSDLSQFGGHIAIWHGGRAHIEGAELPDSLAPRRQIRQ